MIILPTSFCPSVGYFSLIAESGDEGVCIDTGEQYRKQTLRNRALFMTAAGVTSFTIPVAKYGYPAPAVSDIRISEHGDWRHKLDHGLRSGYGTAPFWDHYEEEIRDLIFEDKVTGLIEYNRLWLDWMLKKWDLEARPVWGVAKEGRRFDLDELSAVRQKRYWQVFEGRYGFTPGLSALDLLLSEGPYAVHYLKELGTRLLSDEDDDIDEDISRDSGKE